MTKSRNLSNRALIFNTSSGKFQGREAGAWVNLV